MDATCDHCSHWDKTAAKLNNANGDFGVCHELTDEHANDPEYVIPTLHDGKPVTEKGEHFEMITGANFGCNHFDARSAQM